MRLDSGEVLELEARPNEKILVIRFFTKTITYSLATMFFVFTMLFFVTSISFISEAEEGKENEVEIVQGDTAADAATDLAADIGDGSEDGNQKELDHPFAIMIEYLAELNLDGLINSEELYEIINKHTQLDGKMRI